MVTSILIDKNVAIVLWRLKPTTTNTKLRGKKTKGRTKGRKIKIAAKMKSKVRENSDKSSQNSMHATRAERLVPGKAKKRRAVRRPRKRKHRKVPTDSTTSPSSTSSTSSTSSKASGTHSANLDNRNQSNGLSMPIFADTAPRHHSVVIPQLSGSSLVQKPGAHASLDAGVGTGGPDVAMRNLHASAQVNLGLQQTRQQIHAPLNGNNDTNSTLRSMTQPWVPEMSTAGGGGGVEGRVTKPPKRNSVRFSFFFSSFFVLFVLFCLFQIFTHAISISFH